MYLSTETINNAKRNLDSRQKDYDNEFPISSLIFGSISGICTIPIETVHTNCFPENGFL